MNLNPELTIGAATGMTLFAAFLWGSWFVSLKYIGDYPLDAFLFTALTVSLVFVWFVGITLDGEALFLNIRDTLVRTPARVYLTLLAGATYVTGMRLSLSVMNIIGLSLAQPIQSSVNIFAGTLIAITVGGIPEGVSPLRIMLGAAVLFGAVMMGIMASRVRIRSYQMQPTVQVIIRAGTPRDMHDVWRGLGLALLASAFIPAYSFALSFGLRSTTQPNGLAVLPFMALLATGAHLGVWLCCGLNLTRHHQWHRIAEAGFYVHKFGVGSGLFHYGGNIIQAFATTQLSSAISWPLAMTAGLWSQMWGLLHGELEGAPRGAYITLAAAVALYVIGAYIIVTR